MRRQSALPLLLLAGCAGCVPKREAPPAAAPPVRAAPPAPLPAPPLVQWQDWPVTRGDWVYRKDGRGSIALFGSAGADALVTVRCDRLQGRIYLSRAGTGAGAPMTVRTSSTTRALQARPTGGTPPYLAVELAANDPLVDAMGFSRGRFTVEVPGLSAVVAPSWAEVLRVAEDCR